MQFKLEFLNAPRITSVRKCSWYFTLISNANCCSVGNSSLNSSEENEEFVSSF
jgi:hypothetical protein